MSPLNLVDFNPAMTFKLLGKYTNQTTKRSNVQKPKEKGHIFKRTLLYYTVMQT